MMGFALGGRRIVAAAAEGAWIWALDGAKMLLRHEKGWPWFTISTDGRLLATSTGNFLRIWDVETGVKLFEIRYGDRNYSSVAFVGSDNDLIAATDAGLVKVRWKAEDLVSELCRRLNRNPTLEEWRRFFEDEPPPQICLDRP